MHQLLTSSVFLRVIFSHIAKTGCARLRKTLQDGSGFVHCIAVIDGHWHRFFGMWSVEFKRFDRV